MWKSINSVTISLRLVFIKQMNYFFSSFLSTSKLTCLYNFALLAISCVLEASQKLLGSVITAWSRVGDANQFNPQICFLEFKILTSSSKFFVREKSLHFFHSLSFSWFFLSRFSITRNDHTIAIPAVGVKFSSDLSVFLFNTKLLTFNPAKGPFSKAFTRFTALFVFYFLFSPQESLARSRSQLHTLIGIRSHEDQNYQIKAPNLEGGKIKTERPQLEPLEPPPKDKREVILGPVSHQSFILRNVPWSRATRDRRVARQAEGDLALGVATRGKLAS